MSQKKIIAIAAGKGGVGKSTISVALAQSFSKLGKKVGILDADIYGPSSNIMLSLDQQPAAKDDKILPAKAGDIAYFSVGFLNIGHQASMIRAPIANGIITQFLNQVDWQGIEYLFVDFPPGTGDIQLTLMQQAAIDGVVVVSTPQKVSLADVEKAAQMFTHMNVPILGLIENMGYYYDEKQKKAHYLFGEGHCKAFTEQNKLSFLASLPLDPMVCKNLDEAKNLMQKPSDFSTKIENISKHILDKLTLLDENRPVVKLSEDGQRLKLFKQTSSIDLSAYTIQKSCLCARCQSTSLNCKTDVSIIDIKPVGRYAIKLVFSSGCSSGVYPFRHLEKLSH